MARTAGSKNADYEASRLALARKVRHTLIADEGLRVSVRELARRAKTSVATLRHYFKDRESLLVAVMESLAIDGAPHMARASLPVSNDPRESLRHLLLAITEAWTQHHVGQMQAAMLAEGLTVRRLGPAYVTLLLEPLLQVGERVLQRFIDAGALEPCDVRAAGLTLLAPLVLALLHQDNLTGTACRPLDLPVFIDAHVETFLRAYPVAKKVRQVS